MPVIDRDLFIQLCSQISLFSDLKREEIWQVANSLNYVIKYRPGDTIIHQGAKESSLYVLLSGRAKVTRNDNPELILEKFSAGHIFGEMSLLSGKPRAANVIATSQSICLRVDQKLLVLLPGLARDRIKDALIAILVDRIDRLSDTIAQLRKKVPAADPPPA